MDATTTWPMNAANMTARTGLREELRISMITIMKGEVEMGIEALAIIKEVITKRIKQALTQMAMDATVRLKATPDKIETIATIKEVITKQALTQMEGITRIKATPDKPMIVNQNIKGQTQMIS